MEKSKIPLQIWFEAMWLLTIGRSGFTSSFLENYFDISHAAALSLSKRLRIHMSVLNDDDWASDRCAPYTVDTITVRKVKRLQGRYNNPVRLLGIRSGRHTLTRLIKGHASLLVPRMIREHVPRGAAICLRDCYRYWNLEQSSYDVKYIKDSENLGMLRYNLLSQYWLNLKKQMLGIPNWVGVGQLERYAREYEFRDRLRRYPETMLTKLLAHRPVNMDCTVDGLTGH